MATITKKKTDHEEKEWRVGEAVPMSDNVWTCDIIRVEDGHVVKKILLSPETLPPRFKGKKKVWSLPTDGSIPSFGLFEQDRIIALFKESRKKSKKDKKPKNDIKLTSEPRSSSAAIMLASTCSCWNLRSRFQQWRRESKVIRYTLSELLQFNADSSIKSLPPPVRSTASSTNHLSAPPGLSTSSPQVRHPLVIAPPSAQPLNKVEEELARNAASSVPIPSHLSAPPGLSTSSPQVRHPLVIAPPSARPLNKVEEELAWKANWKMQYLDRLEALAETAWQNHLGQQMP